MRHQVGVAEENFLIHLLAMLSSILNSDTAIEVNIKIIRVFTKLRDYTSTNKKILSQLTHLEKDSKRYGRDIENIFLVLKELFDTQATPQQTSRKRIGFKPYDL